MTITESKTWTATDGTTHPTRDSMRAHNRGAVTTPAAKPVKSHVPTLGILTALDTALSTIRKHNPNVPGAIAIALGTGKGKVNGSFAAESWQDTEGEHKGSARHEILMATESFHRGAEATLTTLIHEAVHASLHAQGIKDTSRQGRYHNQRFAEAAAKAGLVIESDASIGFRTTGLDTSAKVLYARELDALTVALSTFRKPAKKAKAAKTTVKIGCDCETDSGKPLAVTVPISWYDQTDLKCRNCGSTLQEV